VHIVETIAGRVARICINRPEKRNALNLETCRQLLGAFDRAESDPSIGAVVICGNGPAFCAGMDLQEVLSADQEALVDLHERLFTVIQRARKPIVAAVHGAALAAGMGLACNAHIVVASEQASFGLTEIRIGLWPVIVFRSVVRAIGERRAIDLSLTGRTIDASEAKAMGLVSAIVSESSLTQALEWAEKLAGFSPTAVGAGLEYANRTRAMSWEEAAPIGHRMRAELMASDDFTEGVRAFLEKRPPVWPSLHRKV
jgi:methylglutaconyl-CoA hydratase